MNKMKHVQGPYSFTTLPMCSASTAYIIQSEERDTACPSLRTVTPDTPNLLPLSTSSPKGNLSHRALSDLAYLPSGFRTCLVNHTHGSLSPHCVNPPPNLSADVTHLIQPALLKCFAYILPISPIPMRPITGCSSYGASGVTSGFIIFQCTRNKKARMWRGKGCHLHEGVRTLLLSTLLG